MFKRTLHQKINLEVATSKTEKNISAHFLLPYFMLTCLPAYLCLCVCMSVSMFVCVWSALRTSSWSVSPPMLFLVEERWFFFLSMGLMDRHIHHLYPCLLAHTATKWIQTLLGNTQITNMFLWFYDLLYYKKTSKLYFFIILMQWDLK